MQDPSGLCCSAVSHHRRTDSSATQMVRISNLAEQFTVKEEEICETQKELFNSPELLTAKIYCHWSMTEIRVWCTDEIMTGET